MRRYSVCFLLLCICGGARAASYDDFSRGLAANNRGEYDLAISALTSALGAGDLNASLIPVAYLDRGIAHRHKGECKDAVSDLSAAIKLKPDYVDAYWERAVANSCAGDWSAALADLDTLIARRPGKSAYRSRGMLHWENGDFAAAAADFQQAAALDPKDAYVALWLELSRMRAGTLDPAQVSGDIRHIDSDWPMPVLDLYRGKITADEAVKAASKGDAATLTGRQCEADFYVAEWWMAGRNESTAKPLLERAKAECPRGFEEYPAAVTELNRLQ